MILSIQQGYTCMFNFLDKIYFKTYLDDLGSILGSMDINLEDGKPMDLAMLDDWKDAVNSINTSTFNLSSSECYAAMVLFLKETSKRNNSKDLQELAENLETKNTANRFGVDMYNDWMNEVKKIQ